MIRHSAFARFRATKLFFCLFSSVLAAILTGCAGPQKNYELIQEPFLQQSGGILLVVDVCVLQDAIGDADDYHMVSESKSGAMKVADEARAYLIGKGIETKAIIVPFACGVVGPNGNEPQLAKLSPDAPAVMMPRPFGSTEQFATDAALQEALMVLATSTYERAVTEKAALLVQGRQTALPPMKAHTKEEVKAAATLVRAMMNTSGMIHIGVNGYSVSGGKAFAAGTGRFLVALVTGVATGVAVIPGGTTDGYIQTASTINLGTGEMVRVSTMRGIGDPKKPDVVADKRFLHPLLHGLVHREVGEASSVNTATPATSATTASAPSAKSN